MITVKDVLDVFPRSKVIAKDKPPSCDHCSNDRVPEWRRGGKIVLRTWPDGRSEWACSLCGRVAVLVVQQDSRNEILDSNQGLRR